MMLDSLSGCVEKCIGLGDFRSACEQLVNAHERVAGSTLGAHVFGVYRQRKRRGHLGEKLDALSDVVLPMMVPYLARRVRSSSRLSKLAGAAFAPARGLCVAGPDRSGLHNVPVHAERASIRHASPMPCCSACGGTAVLSYMDTLGAAPKDARVSRVRRGMHCDVRLLVRY